MLYSQYSKVFNALHQYSKVFNALHQYSKVFNALQSVFHVNFVSAL